MVSGPASAPYASSTFSRVFLACVAAWLIGSALVLPARSRGDGGEYHLMAESLLRHGSPDLRASDARALAGRAARFEPGINLPLTFKAYFEARDGRHYSCHFWGYSLATLPAKGLLRRLGVNDFRAAPLTNALLMVLALHWLLLRSALASHERWLLALLAFTSPAAWFVLWPTPEAACFALVLLALVQAHAGRRHLPVLWVALAATQNPPLVWLAATLALRALVRARARGAREWAASLGRTGLAVLPAALPPIFYLWHFGRPNLILDVATDLELAGAQRAAELFFDLDIGLLPYVPVTLGVFLAGLLVPPLDRRAVAVRWGRAALLGALALSCTINVNWNNGTAGPSRYTIWMLPLVLTGAVEALGVWRAGAGRVRRALVGAVALLAVASQAGVLVARGGLSQPEDYLRHSWAARLVLRHAPALYNPSAPIFVQRTLGSIEPPAGPVVYRDEDGRCRKAWARPKDARALAASCGTLPPGSEAFFARAERRKTWSYVNW